MGICRRLSKTASRLSRKSERHVQNASELRINSDFWRKKARFINLVVPDPTIPSDVLLKKYAKWAANEKIRKRMIKTANRLGRNAKIETAKAGASRLGARVFARTANRLHNAKKIVSGRSGKNAKQ